MAVYTHFGSMSGLVREMVREGFGRLAAAFRRIGTTEDPVQDLALMGRVYRATSVANAHLYSVMFGGSSLAGFELTEEDLQYGRFNLVPVADCAARCVADGRFTEADPMLLSHHMWVATHGLVTLEIGGFLIEPYAADRCFESQLVTLMVGAGDAVETATASVLASAKMFARDFGPGTTEPGESRGPHETDGLDGLDGRRERAPSERG